MNEQYRHTPQIRAITISQQYGSDGYKIAVKLALRLQWILTDHDLVTQVAHRLNLTEEEATFYDEHTFSFIDRVLFSMRFSAAEGAEAWATSPCIMPLSMQMQERLYRETLQHVVESTVRAGNRVIVGHGAQMILANQPDVLHIRIVAPFIQRVIYAMQREHLDNADARAYIRQEDQKLARYLRSQYHRDAADPLLYDLVINSNALDVEGQVDLIYLALERKARWLALTTSG